MTQYYSTNAYSLITYLKHNKQKCQIPRRKIIKHHQRWGIPEIDRSSYFDFPIFGEFSLMRRTILNRTRLRNFDSFSFVSLGMLSYSVIPNIVFRIYNQSSHTHRHI